MKHGEEFSRDRGRIDRLAADWIIRRDAGLTSAEERALAEWRAADPRHAAALDWHAQTWGALDRPRMAGLAGALQERFSAATARRRRLRLSIATGAAAVLMLAGVLWRQTPRVAERPTLRAPVASSAAVLKPEQRTLPDGSVVELRAGAEIAVYFSEKLRRVELRRGEAHFAVERNPARPFVVAAGGVEVRAVGTAFAVEFAEHEVGVLVTEGKVSVAVPENVGKDAPVFLTALQHVSVPSTATPSDAPAPVAALAEAEAAERLAWRGTRLEFSETPLLTAVAMMNEHAAGPQKTTLVIAGADLGRRPITGLFRADNSEAFVRLVEVSFGAKAERVGDVVTLRASR